VHGSEAAEHAIQSNSGQPKLGVANLFLLVEMGQGLTEAIAERVLASEHESRRR